MYGQILHRRHQRCGAIGGVGPGRGDRRGDIRLPTAALGLQHRDLPGQNLVLAGQLLVHPRVVARGGCRLQGSVDLTEVGPRGVEGAAGLAQGGVGGQLRAQHRPLGVQLRAALHQGRHRGWWCGRAQRGRHRVPVGLGLVGLSDLMVEAGQGHLRLDLPGTATRRQQPRRGRQDRARTGGVWGGDPRGQTRSHHRGGQRRRRDPPPGPPAEATSAWGPRSGRGGLLPAWRPLPRLGPVHGVAVRDVLVLRRGLVLRRPVAAGAVFGIGSVWRARVP